MASIIRLSSALGLPSSARGWGGGVARCTSTARPSEVGTSYDRDGKKYQKKDVKEDRRDGQRSIEIPM